MADLTKTEKSSGPLEYSTEEGSMKIFGFWIFLGAEIVLFATLFATYLVLQGQTAGGPTAKDLFVVKDFMIETLLLLISSFTCGLSVLEMRKGSVKGYMAWMAVTLLLGLGFLAFEITEFVHYVHKGATLQTSAFLSAFFILVGTHGAHVTLGILWVLLVMIQIGKHGFTPVTARKAFITGLYWHFLDVVWIFIFTAVYLLGVM
jgi:cytochrome aa3-600 menaquinol oxidase subunit III